MCGIFGSTDKERFLTLYKLNKKRGTFATSIIFSNSYGDLIVHRWSGSADTKVVENELNKHKEAAIFYIGHTQAPTSTKRKYSKETSHPFNYESFTIAHNGVLSNFSDLKENFSPKWPNPVDSSIIPYVIHKMQHATHNTCDSTEAVARALSLLEGTFGVWVYDSSTRRLFIARCGSTLFANVLKNDFSSVKFPDSEPLEEGYVYQLTPEGITSVTNFDFDSPFFA